MDRNTKKEYVKLSVDESLSARRAWIEILIVPPLIDCLFIQVALRKESVDRNMSPAHPELLNL